ncbi:MAG: hypothetical protein JSW39_23995 [Desulfobacterales bacterium]|nr:MAG: hypothetical protein JSW39_23995 [Desulfobacterales bacterium]
MQTTPLSEAPFMRVLILITVFLAFPMTLTARADSLKQLQQNLPTRVLNWTAEPADQFYDPATIFSYIDGGAEVYKAYHMQQCFSRRYANPGAPAIVLDIFDMGSSLNAFGVFTHDTDGEVLALGQDARLKPGWLSFWSDRFFVSIYTEEETPAAAQAVRALGQQVAGRIKPQGAKPRILARLPTEGLDSGSIRYLHHPVVLNYHYYLADENILDISHRTPAVLARYQRDRKEARLLLVDYPDPQSAEKALAGFLKDYLPDADSRGAALLENGRWAAAELQGQLLAVVLESDTRQLAVSLLAQVFNSK